ncbi:MAG: hypothetical protein HY718_11770 [Planctomycetes bacterium]|nr:hypothetical protein [Planctomycetota bacterium]
MRQMNRVAVCLGVGGLLVWSSTGLGVVQAIDAVVESSVVQRLAGGVVNTDTAFESLDETTPNLPLIAESRLERLDLDNNVFSLGSAVAVFSDPRLSTSDDPDELGADIAVFSLDPVDTYDADTHLTEVRQVTFTADEIGAADGTPLEVTSFFFLEGYMLVWGDLSTAPSASVAELTIRVQQTRPGDAAPVTVLEANLSLSHDSSGNPVVTAGGALTVDNVVLADTSDVIVLGQAGFVSIPQIGIPYIYQAAVGEAFTLTAEVDCHAANQPFTGAGVTLGKSAEDFLDIIAGLIGEPVGTNALQINGVTTGPIVLAAKPLPMGETQVKVLDGTGFSLLNLSRPFCGLLGLESALFLAAVPLMMLPAFRRKWPPLRPRD